MSDKKPMDPIAFQFPPLDEAVARWKAGHTVWSAELGGIGPGYEQCIQILLWETLAAWGDRSLPLPEKEGEYPKEYSDFVDQMVTNLNLGFSGAQVGAAKSTAYQFLRYGYRHMMGKLEKERHILVEKHFPSMPRVA